MQLEQHVAKSRQKMIEDYLNCLHQHAVVKELKLSI